MNADKPYTSSSAVTVRQPRPGAALVPPGKQVKEGVEYGCGWDECEECYEPAQAPPPPLHRYDYVEVDGRMESRRFEEVYVWAAVHTATGK